MWLFSINANAIPICLSSSGQITYEEKCPEGTKNIGYKRSPEAEAAAKAKLEAWNKNYHDQEMAKQKIADEAKRKYDHDHEITAEEAANNAVFAHQQRIDMDNSTRH